MKLKLSDKLEEEIRDEPTPPLEPKIPFGVYLAVGACALAVFATLWLMMPKEQDTPTEQTTTALTTVEPVTTVTTTTVVNDTTTTVSAKPLEDAKDTLERPTDVATEEDTKTVSDAIQKMLQFAKDGFKGDAFEHHSRYMDITYVNMLKHIVQGKYTLNPSSIAVTNSEHENVLQFVFDMTDENGNTVAFAGNYRKFDTQIQLENIKGFNPTGAAASDKQYDEDKAGFHE